MVGLRSCWVFGSILGSRVAVGLWLDRTRLESSVIFFFLGGGGGGEGGLVTLRDLGVSCGFWIFV